jgi:hypothetical protein
MSIFGNLLPPVDPAARKAARQIARLKTPENLATFSPKERAKIVALGTIAPIATAIVKFATQQRPARFMNEQAVLEIQERFPQQDPSLKAFLLLGMIGQSVTEACFTGLPPKLAQQLNTTTLSYIGDDSEEMKRMQISEQAPAKGLVQAGLSSALSRSITLISAGQKVCPYNQTAVEIAKHQARIVKGQQFTSVSALNGAMRAMLPDYAGSIRNIDAAGSLIGRGFNASIVKVDRDGAYAIDPSIADYNVDSPSLIGVDQTLIAEIEAVSGQPYSPPHYSLEQFLHDSAAKERPVIGCPITLTDGVIPGQLLHTWVADAYQLYQGDA